MGNDLLDTIKDALDKAGLGPVVPSLADGRSMPEAIILGFGVPSLRTIDYAGTQEETLRATVIVKRLSERHAQEDACRAQRALRFALLESENGSYCLKGIEIDAPQPLPWDESGRWVWAFDIRVTTTRKDFF